MADILDSIPEILMYVVPGFITTAIIFNAKATQVNHSTRLIWSIAISAITLSAMFAVTKIDVESVNYWRTLFWCVTWDILIGILVRMLFSHQKFAYIMQKLFASSPHDCALLSTINWDSGNYVFIYLKEKPYYIQGSLVTADRDMSGWVCLEEPTWCNLDGSIIEHVEYEGIETVAVPAADIEYMRLIE